LTRLIGGYGKSELIIASSNTLAFFKSNGALHIADVPVLPMPRFRCEKTGYGGQ